MSQLYLIDRHGSPLSSARILDVQESTSPPTTPFLGGRFVVKVPDGIPVVKPVNLGDLLIKKAQGYLLFYAGFTRATYDDLLDTSNIDFTNSVGLVAGQRNTLVLQPGGILQSLVTPLTAGLSGSAANITVTAGPVVTVTGLTGMQPGFVGNPLTISGSSVLNNDGTFPIASYISPTSVTITNPLAATDTGSDSWSAGPIPSQVFITWDTYSFIENDASNGPHTRQYQELPSIPANVLCQVSFDGTTFTPTTDSAILSVPIPQQGSSFIMQLTNASPNRLSIGSWTLVY